MKNGFIIVHYNDSKSIIELLNNIKDYNIIDKIVIVDNNSRVDDLDKLKKFRDSKIELIENSSNLGFSKAINQGAKQLIKEFGKCNLIVSNCDIEINSEDDLSKLLNYLNNDDIGLLAPTVLENGSLNRGWKNPTPFIDSLINMVGIGKVIRKRYLLYEDSHYNSELTSVDVVSGCFFLIRSDVLEKINYLDENTFLYYEENILSKKVKNINLRVVVSNDVKVKHNHSVSIDKNVNKINKLKMQKKSGYYFQKEYNHANILTRFLYKSTAFINRNILRVYYLFKK